VFLGIVVNQDCRGGVGRLQACQARQRLAVCGPCGGGEGGSEELSEACELEPEVSREFRADLRMEVEGTSEVIGEP
jgi:uncharacterized protein YciI